MEKLESLIIEHFTIIIFIFSIMWLGLIAFDLIALFG